MGDGHREIKVFKYYFYPKMEFSQGLACNRSTRNPKSEDYLANENLRCAL
jgi:hypothetical protein